MALRLISANANPTYIALSTDISGSKISGAALLGKTVYITDTQDWYIISGSDLLLEPYVIPANET